MSPLRLPHGYHLDRVTEPHHIIVRDQAGEEVCKFYEYAPDTVIEATVEAIVAPPSPVVPSGGTRPEEPADLHSPINEALDATGWSEERREAFMCDFLFAFCVESEEMRTVEEWIGGSDPADDPREMRPR